MPGAVKSGNFISVWPPTDALPLVALSGLNSLRRETVAPGFPGSAETEPPDLFVCIFFESEFVKGVSSRVHTESAPPRESGLQSNRKQYFTPISPTATVHRVPLKAARSPGKRRSSEGEEVLCRKKYSRRSMRQRRFVSFSRESIAIACQHASVVQSPKSPDLSINPLTFAINPSK